MSEDLQTTDWKLPAMRFEGRVRVPPSGRVENVQVVAVDAAGRTAERILFLAAAGEPLRLNFSSDRRT